MAEREAGVALQVAFIGAVDPGIYEFYSLGLGDPIALSAVHGHGTGDFLDECVAHFLFVLEGEDEDGTPRWFWFEGNFADYEVNKLERLGPEAARPHRSTHRRLTR